MSLPPHDQKALEVILDFLQQEYKYRLDASLIPSSLHDAFWKAVARFSNPRALESIDRAPLRICEEVGDLAYQCLKLTCLTHRILTDTTITALDEHLERNGYYDADRNVTGLDYAGLEALGQAVVPEIMIEETRRVLPPELFVQGGDNGHSILRAFLGGQFVAHISRKWRGAYLGDEKALAHMADAKIPEETRELLEALFRTGEDLEGDALVAEMQENIEIAQGLIDAVLLTRRMKVKNPLTVFRQLPAILSKRVRKPTTVEETLRIMFLKMKGRQEMDFLGVDRILMRRTCFPVERLIEADMFS